MLFFNRNTITAKVNGLNDFQLVERITASLSKVEGVITVHVNPKKKIIKVKVQNSKSMDLSKISKAISEAGFECLEVKNY